MGWSPAPPSIIRICRWTFRWFTFSARGDDFTNSLCGQWSTKIISRFLRRFPPGWARDKSFSRPPCNVCQVVIHVFSRIILRSQKAKLTGGSFRVIEFLPSLLWLTLSGGKLIPTVIRQEGIQSISNIYCHMFSFRRCYFLLKNRRIKV